MSAERDEARESPAVREGAIAAIMAGFFIFVVAAAIGLFFFYEALRRDTTFVKVEEFPSPRLQTRADGLRDPEIARQQADLQRFRWIDRAHGAFQIPIERAMRRKRRAARGPTSRVRRVRGAGGAAQGRVDAMKTRLHALLRALALATAILTGEPAGAALAPDQLTDVGVRPPPGATLPLDARLTGLDGRPMAAAPPSATAPRS